MNSHATSTPKGDIAEAQSIKELLLSDKDSDISRPTISANKGNIGHLVSAAAVVESIFAIKSLQTGEIPAIKNLNSSDHSGKINHDDIPVFNGLNYATENREDDKINVILKNSLVFGGINLAAIFKRL